MRNYQKVAGFVLPLLLVAAQAYATIEATGIEVPGKTLADFQKEYSGTKPIVAWHRYQEHKRLESAPRPTLEASRMRTEPLVFDEYAGTKPVVRFMNRNRPSTRGTGAISVRRPDDGSGTKPVVALLRKRS